LCSQVGWLPTITIPHENQDVLFSSISRIDYEIFIPTMKSYVSIGPMKAQGVVSHCGLAIYIEKYLKAKEELLWKLKYFTIQKL
jgi:hypothetical protein